jgi:hypothetical protein
MTYRATFFVIMSCVLSGAVPKPPGGPGARRVAPQNAYVRMIAMVPLTGSGTKADPIRPEYAPLPRPRGSKFTKPDLSGIIGFNFIMADDKKHAIVEFVARDRAAFRQLLADRRADVKVFEKGKARKSDIETEFRKHKAGINLDRLTVSVP